MRTSGNAPSFYLDEFEANTTHEGHNLDLTIQVTFHQLDMGGICGELSEGRIDGNPVLVSTQAHLGPRMVVEGRMCTGCARGQ